jgi:hypothetical protein
VRNKRIGMWSGDISALIMNFGTRWVICHLEIPLRFPILWRLFQPLKRYENLIDEMNVSALSGIVLPFLGCLARFQ